MAKKVDMWPPRSSWLWAESLINRDTEIRLSSQLGCDECV